MNKRRGRSRHGQLRVIEATIAAIMIFFSFITASYFTRTPRSWTLSRYEDLARMGYNVLHSLAVTGVLDKTIASKEQGWENRLNFILEAFLPSTVFYNLTVYKVLSKSNGWQTEFKAFNTIKITNTESDEAFISSPEVVSISYLFTSRNGDAYSLILQISEMRGEAG